MRTLTIGAAVLLLGAAAVAQDSGKRLEYEVASVKPAPLPAGGFINLGPPSGPGTADPTRIHYSFNSMRNLLMIAYGVKTFQITGPAWMDTERYDVVATVAPGTTKEQAAVMLQNLLADRFQLKLHHETKDLPLYEMTVGKSGPRLKPYVEDPNGPKPPEPGQPFALPEPGKDGMPKPPPGATLTMMMNGKLHLISIKANMARLTDVLSNNLRMPVVDKTGITGEYDFDLEFATEGLAGAPPPPPVPAPGLGPASPTPGGDSGEAPGLMTAVQEQLGLKLDQKKGPLDMLIIDHLEKVPAEN